MKCPKCEGLMFMERFSDFFLTFSAWKCVNCATIIDQTILSNKSGIQFEPTPVVSGKNRGR